MGKLYSVVISTPRPPPQPLGSNLRIKLGGVCAPLPKTRTLLSTKICDFAYPIYGLNKIPYYIYDRCGLYSCPNDNFQKAFVDDLINKASSKNHIL